MHYNMVPKVAHGTERVKVTAEKCTKMGFAGLKQTFLAENTSCGCKDMSKQYFYSNAFVKVASGARSFPVLQ
jgi:hypothetical protein